MVCVFMASKITKSNASELHIILSVLWFPMVPVFLTGLNNKNCVQKFCGKIFLRTFAIAESQMEP